MYHQTRYTTCPDAGIARPGNAMMPPSIHCHLCAAMKLRVVLVVAVIAGMVLEVLAPSTTSSLQPPLGWRDLLFVFFGSAIGISLVLGFQAVLRNGKSLRWGWYFFAISTAFLLGAGLSGIAIALASKTLQPASFLCLALACGMSGTLAALKAVFPGRFQDAA
ncbi:hypothetical protein [Chitiniphilus shinanonensis]|nr:hypothetical protein [Chitiniphilus shinanonensis]